MNTELIDAKINYYDVLGVDKKATSTEIKKRFQKLSRIYHPDKARGLSAVELLKRTEEFSLITKAFAVLSDETYRRDYDQTRAATFDELRTAFHDAAAQYDAQREVPPELEDVAAGSNVFQERFNAIFESQRAPQPGDSGAGEYGRELAPRRSLQEGVHYDPNDVEAPDRLFEDGKFDNDKFQQMFEHFNQVNKGWGSNSIVQVRPEDPDPWNSSMMDGATELGTSVSSYGGLMIVDDERQSYDSASRGVDYRGAFGVRNPTMNEFRDLKFDNPRTVDKKLTVGELDALMSERLRDREIKLKPKPTDEEFRADQKRFTAEKEKQILAEQEQNRKVVAKYSRQFPAALAQQAFDDPNGIQDEFTR